MKKTAALLLALLMGVLTLTACGGTGAGGKEAQEQAQGIDSIRTFGDLLTLESDTVQTAVTEDTLIYVFELGGIYYRASSAIDQATAEALFEVDFFSPDDADKVRELVGDLEIEKIENLNETILSQEELDALMGKTGQELLDDGWVWTGHDLEAMEFWMQKGAFTYTIVFDGKVDEADYDTFDAEEGIREMTVKSAAFYELGDATNIE